MNSFSSQGKFLTINCLYNPANILELYAMPYHDMSINTIRTVRNDIYAGEDFRITDGARDRNFEDVHGCLIGLYHQKIDLNHVQMPVGIMPDIKKMQKTEVIDSYTDKNILTAYKDDIGHVCIQISDYRPNYQGPDRMIGPVVVLCSPVDESSGEVLKARASAFSNFFEATKKLAESFNDRTINKGNQNAYHQ